MCHDTQGLRFFLITKKPKRAKNVLPCKKSAKMLKRFSVLPVFSFLLSPLPSFPHTFLLFPEPKLTSATLSHQNPAQTPKTWLQPQIPKATGGVWPSLLEGLGYFNLFMYFILSIWRWEHFQGISLSAAFITWCLDAEFLILLDSNNKEFEVSSEIQLCVFWKWSNCWISVSLAHL